MYGDSQPIRPRTVYTDKLRVINYIDQRSIWDFGGLFYQKDYKNALHIYQRIQEDAEMSSTVKNDSVKMYFQFAVSSQNQRRYPDSLLSGLVKLGGLLGLFKLTMFMGYFHKRNFEAKIIRQLKKGKDIKQLTGAEDGGG